MGCLTRPEDFACYGRTSRRSRSPPAVPPTSVFEFLCFSKDEATDHCVRKRPPPTGRHCFRSVRCGVLSRCGVFFFFGVVGSTRTPGNMATSLPCLVTRSWCLQALVICPSATSSAQCSAHPRARRPSPSRKVAVEHCTGEAPACRIFSFLATTLSVVVQACGR
jgi:hypothetical protein